GAFMLGNLTNEQRNISLISMKEIAYADEKLLKEEPNHVAYLAAHENVYARRVMRKFTYNRYYMIDVLGDKNQVLRTLTETQIMNALLTKSIKITIGEIF
ncbi:MAG: hypothetical protein RR957_04220, partial [Oscillospiraceae bacterium]